MTLVCLCPSLCPPWPLEVLELPHVQESVPQLNPIELAQEEERPEARSWGGPCPCPSPGSAEWELSLVVTRLLGKDQIVWIPTFPNPGPLKSQ
jgi:hypothetical protein